MGQETLFVCHNILFLSVSFILAESKEVIKLIKKVRVSTFSC